MITLGDCKCACDDGCPLVEENDCKFAVHFFGDDDAPLTFLDAATQQDKDCLDKTLNPFGCGDPLVSYEFSMEACDGEGKVYRLNAILDLDPFGNPLPITRWQVTEIATFTAPFVREPIDLENIQKLDLTEGDRLSFPKPCKFSYNFSFNGDANTYGYAFAEPCDPSLGLLSFTLDDAGTASFKAYYDETSKLCSITPG